MKKLFLIVALCGLGGFAKAQSVEHGLKFGANLGTASVNEIREGWESDGITAGIHAGLFAKLGLGPLYLQPEAYYTFTKARLSRNSTQYGTQDLQMDFHRLDVPVLVGFQILSNLRVNAGPFGSVLIDANAESPQETIEDQANDYYNRATWGWQAGLGMDFRSLTFDARYETTVGDLSDQDFRDPNLLNHMPRGQQQRQIVVSIGVKF